MAKMMTKSSVVSALSDKCSLTKKQVVAFMDEFQSLAVKEAKKTGFIVPGFGKLVLSNRKARMGRNPQTGEPIKIPAKRVVRFRVAKAMKDLILGAKK